MASDKISVINDSLALTGNNLVAVEDDGSDEWLVASAAFESAVEYLLDEHDWKFATDIVELTRTGDSTDTNAYTDEYAKPDDALHIVWVKVAGTLVTDYKIVRNRIQVSGPSLVTVKYVKAPGPEVWSGLFGKAVRQLTMAGIYRGLNEDPGTADKEESKADIFLNRARARGDLEEPGRPRFISGLADSRRVRRGT